MTRPLKTLLLAALGVALVVGLVAARALRPAYRRWAESRVKLIDDFNDGTETNLIGGEPFVQAPAEGQLNPTFLRIKTPSPGEIACALGYALPQGASAAWGTGLNDLDISAAKTLRFWLKADALPLPQLAVELVDGFGAKAQSAIPRLRSTTRWQLVVIPVGAFRTVNFNRLGRFALRLNAPDGSRAGTLHLDDVAFVGPSSLFFRSLQDNLFGFPSRVLVRPARLLAMPPEPMLRAIASDTWGYFRDLVDRRHHLPLNYIQTKPARIIGDYASTTDVAMYLLSVVSALDFDLIDRTLAVERLRGTLGQLAELPKWNGFFYNYYNTTNLQVTNQYISSVDNAWLAVALVVIRQAFPELAAPVERLLKPMDFKTFYDPANGQMRLGYEMKEGRFAPYHYGLLSTEARIISVIAIGKGDVGEDHWFRVYRTLPKEWTWQRQAPQGSYKSYQGHDVFQGYYLYDDGKQKTPFVPSWGGSLFEFLMPTLVVDERRLAPHGLGLNDQRAVDIHIQYATNDRALPVWGLSPCATPEERHGGYSEFGIAALGAKGYKDEAIVTPHVTMLSLLFAPEQAEENLRQLLRRFAMYGPYGFYDSVDVQTGAVAHRYLALDQGMSLIALNNYVNDGAIQRRFAADPIMKRIKPLLAIEKFFED